MTLDRSDPGTSEPAGHAELPPGADHTAIARWVDERA